MKKLVVYITSAFPNINFTIDLALSLKESGVDMLELGIPFSDPVADGPIIDLANQRALKLGFKIDHLFEISKKIAKEIDTLWMGYFNSFYHKGLEFFLSKALEHNISALIIPDMPKEELFPHKKLFDSYNIVPITFIAPTDTKERINKLVNDAKKFIYLVAYAGITGSDKNEELKDVISNIRDSTTTPIYLGFGVNKDNIKEKSKDVDGVIVGSAIVKILLDDNLSESQKIKTICEMTKEMKGKMND